MSDWYCRMGCASDWNEKWVSEGRRLVPLLPRLVPQTAFTAAATNAANLQAEKNLAMCPPADTPFQEGTTIHSLCTLTWLCAHWLTLHSKRVQSFTHYAH